MHRTTTALLIGLALAAAGRPAARLDAQPGNRATLERLRRLDERHDVFALRRALQTFHGRPTPEVRFYRALTESAFNALDASNRTLSAVLAAGHLSRSLRYRALDLRRRNDVRLGRYAAAAAAAVEELGLRGVADPTETARLRDDLRLLHALAGVPAQTTDIAADTTLPFRAGAGGRPCVPVHVNGTPRCYGLSPASPYSTMSRADARALGLTTRATDFPVARPDAPDASADVTVVDRLTIGHVVLRHVVFLVVPSGGGTGRPAIGLLGLPVVTAIGEMDVRHGAVLHVPRAVAPVHPGDTLAIVDGRLLVPIDYGGRQGLGRFDPDAARTVFYEPFFRRFRTSIVRDGKPHFSTVDRGGGPQPIPGFQLHSLRLAVAGTPVTITPADVYATLIGNPRRNYLFCDVGQDALGQFQTYVLDFRAMRLELEN